MSASLVAIKYSLCIFMTDFVKLTGIFGSAKNCWYFSVKSQGRALAYVAGKSESTPLDKIRQVLVSRNEFLNIIVLF